MGECLRLGVRLPQRHRRDSPDALYERRGIDDFLTPALFDARIEPETLEAMFAAVRARREVPWRYYRLKARILGVDRLRFCDTMAPYPLDSSQEISWTDGVATVLGAFRGFYPRLADFADSAIDRRWVDYEPRAAKRPGAFCVRSNVIDESRVFMTFNQTAGDVQTLAHELGHAFHGEVMKGMRYWATCYPMTLAETASTFAEEVVSDALLSNPKLGRNERLASLDARLSDAATFMCNTPMRFSFEKAFYEERAAGEVSTGRLCELMREAQREWYGDSVDPEALDPWFWASKLHFYIPELSFYNFPYTFGFLFSMALFATAKERGPSFFASYERLLQRAGSAPAEAVAREALDVDISDAAFWHRSIDQIESELEHFEAELSSGSS